MVLSEKLNFSKIELEVIQNYLYMFDTLKEQYAIFKFINNANNRKNTNKKLHNSLSQALFRHIIIELYGLFFDESKYKDEVSYSAIIRKLKSHIGYKTRIHRETLLIDYLSIDDNSIGTESMEYSFTLESFITEMTKFHDTIEIYRNKVLAHKYAYNKKTETIELEYKLTYVHLEDLIKFSEKVLLCLFKVAFPTTANEGCISYYVKDREIFNYFNNLSYFK